jgi:hypothetical integral membrane protein (TIGR02206 family)
MESPGGGRFVAFGADHLAALGLAVLAAFVLSRVARGRSRGGAVVLRVALAALLASLAGYEVSRAVREGWFAWPMIVPLQICDAAIWLAILSLLSLNRRLAEILYFWALSGGTLALLTPDVYRGFPDLEFFVFFGLHGLVVASACVLVFGFGLVPPAGAPWRAFAVTAAFAALAAGVNALFGTNYMYLAHKPSNPTLLDRMGPWPVYLLAGAALALVLFHIVDLPLARLRRRRTGAKHA